MCYAFLEKPNTAQHSAFYLPCMYFFFKTNTHRTFAGTIYLHATSLLFFLFFSFLPWRGTWSALTSACATSYTQTMLGGHTSYNARSSIYPASFFFCRYPAPSAIMAVFSLLPCKRKKILRRNFTNLKY